MARLSPLPALALLMGAAAAFAQVPASPEFVVNTYTYQEQRRPALALDDSGNFVVAWQSNFEDGSGYGVFAQRFDAAGIRRGGEFQVSTSTAFHQYLADVAVDPSGDFLVVWVTADWPRRCPASCSGPTASGAGRSSASTHMAPAVSGIRRLRPAARATSSWSG